MKKTYRLYCSLFLISSSFTFANAITWDFTQEMGGTYIPRSPGVSNYTHKISTIRDAGEPIGSIGSFTVTIKGSIDFPTYYGEGGIEKGTLFTQGFVMDTDVLGIPIMGIPFNEYLRQYSYTYSNHDTFVNYMIQDDLFSFTATRDIHSMTYEGVESFLSDGRALINFFVVSRTVTEESISQYVLIDPGSMTVDEMKLDIHLVPEPATVSLLALGGLALLRKR